VRDQRYFRLLGEANWKLASTARTGSAVAIVKKEGGGAPKVKRETGGHRIKIES